MYLRIWAILFGITLILAGVAGFLPTFSSDGLLFGIFEVDFMHNSVHLLSGLIALVAAANFNYAKIYFQIFGIIYGIVTILGFLWNGDLYIMHVNMADNLLHLGIAIVALYLGFSARRRV